MRNRIRRRGAALVGTMLAVAGCTAVVVGDSQCARAGGNGIEFGKGQSRILSHDATMDPPPSNPKQDLRLTVTVTVTYDGTTALYAYAYAVENQRQSGNSIDIFGVAPVPRPTTIHAPAHWAGDYGWEEQKNAVVWSVVDDPGTQVPPDSLHALDVPPSPYASLPNSTTTGFTLLSRQPPVTVTFYAQGSDSLLAESEDEGDILPLGQTLFTNGVSGSVLGPDINSTVGAGGKPNDKGVGIEFRQPSPNPAKNGVNVAYFLPRPARVQLGVYDVSGRLVRLLVDGARPAGLHSVSWNGFADTGEAAKSGVYFSRLTVDGRQAGQRRITILR